MDKTVKVWDPFRSRSCIRTLTQHEEAVRGVRWSHDDRNLLTASYDKTAALIDVETGTTLHSYRHKEFVTGSAVLSPFPPTHQTRTPHSP